MLIGIISDTHDLLRPEAKKALGGVEQLIHCGDVCNPGLLDELRVIAPVRAVRGNCDHGAWASELPLSDTFEIGGVLIHVRHILPQLDLDPVAAQISLVLSGHSHEPHRYEERGVTYFNPGSAGARRFSLPITLALMRIEDGAFEIDLQELVGA